MQLYIINKLANHEAHYYTINFLKIINSVKQNVHLNKAKIKEHEKNVQ